MLTSTRAVLSLMLLLLVFSGGCATTTTFVNPMETNPYTALYYHTWRRECAWCKASFDKQEVRVETLAQGTPERGSFFWLNEEAAKEQTEQLYNQKYPARYTMDGYSFCSLKCMNSYIASKDIKEKRLRVIEGE